MFNESELQARKKELETSQVLGRVASRLRHLLEPVVDRTVPEVPGKAKLTRKGGVCPVDGTRLAFDPLAEGIHRCPQCGREVIGEVHDAMWRGWYHLWLSERVVHLGVLGALLNEPDLLMRGLEIVTSYAETYPALPNSDNVLGPSRLATSTYIESIWLTQMAIGLSFIAPHDSIEEPAIEMIRGSAELIREFDESWSNRQVWHNTAMMAAGLYLADDQLVEGALEGPHGIRAQLEHGVTDDGMWFEGDNYHFFALRGFQLAAELARECEVDLYADSAAGDRLRAMYVAPIRSLYPDLSMPARGDSPFGVTVVQPRFAELWEVGLARTKDPLVESLLSGLYAADHPELDDIGFEEIAEHEVHRPPAKLSRDRLGWRALLWMRASSPESVAGLTGAVTVYRDAGVVVVRPSVDAYVSLETGGQRGGHGHPDMLHANIFLGEPILIDPGTASYVDKSLFWYRSAEAHNGPYGLVGEQTGREGWCSAADAAEGWAWCRGTARNVLGKGSTTTRTLIASDAWAVDIVEVEVGEDVEVVLPIHLPAGVHRVNELAVESADKAALALLVPRSGETLVFESGLAPPSARFAPGKPVDYMTRRARGSGRWVQVFGMSASEIESVTESGEEIVVKQVGEEWRITVTGTEARIRDRAAREIRLAGERTPSTEPRDHGQEVHLGSIEVPLLHRAPKSTSWRSNLPGKYVHELGPDHYRRSELAYTEAGAIRASAAVAVVGNELMFAVDVAKRDLTFRGEADPDPELDNERPDIHSDGVQCYVGYGGWCGFLLIPEREPTVRCIALESCSGGVRSAYGEWSKTADGYAMVAWCELESQISVGDRFLVNLVVNEMYPNRERRAGQLVLSRDSGWVYLRGDREYPERALIAEVV